MEQFEIERGSRLISESIKDALEKRRGFLIGRFGTIELEAVLTGSHVSPEQSSVLERNAGVFPSTGDSVKQWQCDYANAIRDADILATGWYPPLAKSETLLLHKLGWSGQQVKLRSLEPYYVDPALRWTQWLANQDICVVSSFAQTMETQIKHAAEIWKDMTPASLLPPTSRWHWVRTGYAPVLAQGRATWMDALDEDVSSWSEAVVRVEENILATGATVILLGCGGLAMILGARLKAKGKICIILGGAIQVLFGLKGGRWESHSIIRQFWNEAWVWPQLEETPRCANDVERACYWKVS